MFETFWVFTTSNSLAMVFALAVRISVVVIDGPGFPFSHLFKFDSSGVVSKESAFIVTASFRCWGLSTGTVLYK